MTDKQQDDIWSYTYKTWGEKQAENYIKGLHQHLKMLIAHKSMWRQISALFMPTLTQKIPVYFNHYQRHYIFFRELPNGDLGVMSILHDSMDIPVRLQEDLSYVEAQHE